MPIMDAAVNTASRLGVAAIGHVVNVAHVGRGDDSADSGLAAFPTTNGVQIRNQASRLGVLIMNNRDEGELHVSIKTSQTVEGLELADRVVSIAAEGSTVLGPFAAGVYNVINHEDSDEEEAEHTDYVQFFFAVDTESGTETLAAGDILVMPFTIPAA